MLKDGTPIFGRWTAGAQASSASTDPDSLDLYVGEIGSIDSQGRYVPQTPKRGGLHLRW